MAIRRANHYTKRAARLWHRWSDELWRRLRDGRGWRRLCSFSNPFVASLTSQLILINNPFRGFIYGTACSSTLPSLRLRQSLFSKPSVASPMSHAVHTFFSLFFKTIIILYIGRTQFQSIWQYSRKISASSLNIYRISLDLIYRYISLTLIHFFEVGNPA